MNGPDNDHLPEDRSERDWLLLLWPAAIVLLPMILLLAFCTGHGGDLQ